MQPTENTDQIFVIVIDETYDSCGKAWQEESEKYRIGLEKEFGVRFEEANVGPAADLPAFITVIATTDIPLWSVLIGAFFLGKKINENLDAWGDIGRKLDSFFGRPVILARNGASALAISAAIEEMGVMPQSIRLLSYRPMDIRESDDLRGIVPSSEIRENVPTLYLGYVRHLFEIEVDGEAFRVSVEGKNTKVLRL